MSIKVRVRIVMVGVDFRRREWRKRERSIGGKSSAIDGSGDGEISVH